MKTFYNENKPQFPSMYNNLVTTSYTLYAIIILHAANNSISLNTELKLVDLPCHHA